MNDEKFMRQAIELSMSAVAHGNEPFGAVLVKDDEVVFSNENQIEILEYTEGQRVKKIKVGNLELSGTEIRNIFGLKSAKFEIIIEDENIKFNVLGYGHGVGMSQTGADSMAKEGKGYEEIIKHYYTGVEIVNI